MNRRSFLASLATFAAAVALDPPIALAFPAGPAPDILWTAWNHCRVRSDAAGVTVFINGQNVTAWPAVARRVLQHVHVEGTAVRFTATGLFPERSGFIHRVDRLDANEPLVVGFDFRGRADSISGDMQDLYVSEGEPTPEDLLGCLQPQHWPHNEVTLVRNGEGLRIETSIPFIGDPEHLLEG